MPEKGIVTIGRVGRELEEDNKNKCRTKTTAALFSLFFCVTYLWSLVNPLHVFSKGI